MTKTTNYQLPKWEKTDRIQMKDFNDMTATLDAALKANADAAAAASAAVALCGNCKIETSTYTGNDQFGKEHPTSLTFPKCPAMFFVLDPVNAIILFCIHGASKARIIGSSVTPTCNWTGNTISWYAGTESTSQFNIAQRVYTVFAFFEQES